MKWGIIVWKRSFMQESVKNDPYKHKLNPERRRTE